MPNACQHELPWPNQQYVLIGCHYAIVDAYEKNIDSLFDSYRFVLPGYNVRPLELEGAIGIEQLLKLPNFISERRKNGALFQNTMNTHPDLMIQEEIGNSSWFGFSLVIKPESKIDRRRQRECNSN